MLTLKKVKELVEAPSHAKRTPSPKMLFEEGIVLLRREFDQGSHLTVYNSGYVLFSAGKRNTVFHIHDCCGDYAYDAAEGKGDVIKEEYFENCEWHIRALFEGERKMEDNQAKCEGAGRSNVCVSYHALSTIVNILKKREYLGHTINFKTRKHFKDKKSHYVSEDEWTIFENTHEAIIDQQTFDLVQKIRSNVRRYPNGWGEAAPLTGLLYCADCGGKMYVHRTNNGKRISQYTCSNYTKVPCGTLCLTQHRINESAVLTLVSDTLRAIAEYSRNDRTEFIHTVQETQVAQQSADISKKRRRLAAAQKRAGELEKLICKIYEDNALGKLPDARYRALDAQYAKEQDALEIEIAELEKAVTGYEQSQKSAEKFIALIDKYENFDTLTNTMLNEFVEKILVHERARKGSQDTTQEIEIYFNFLGRYIPPSLQPVPLTPEEQEELRKKEERKDRLHQNYLKRKASGAQKWYEDKIKAKKKAEMDAKKALIRAEDMKKGVFSTIGQLPKEEPHKGSIAASAAV